LTVSNLGPATAPGVVLTNWIPPEATFVSASPGYTLSGGIVTFTNLGSIGGGAQAIATVVVKAPLVSATLTDNAGTFSTLVTDPLKGNNKTSIKTVVNAVPLTLTHQGTNFVISWPSGTGNYVLEAATNLVPPIVWNQVTNPPAIQNAGVNTITLPFGPVPEFFRLRAPVP
jgi:hypothetical protein